MDPIFQTSILGIKAVVYSDRVTYRAFPLAPEQIIPVGQISSIEIGMPGMQSVILETTGGKRYTMVIRLKDKKAFCDAVMGIINKIKS